MDHGLATAPSEEQRLSPSRESSATARPTGNAVWSGRPYRSVRSRCACAVLSCVHVWKARDRRVWRKAWVLVMAFSAGWMPTTLPTAHILLAPYTNRCPPRNSRTSAMNSSDKLAQFQNVTPSAENDHGDPQSQSLSPTPTSHPNTPASHSLIASLNTSSQRPSSLGHRSLDVRTPGKSRPRPPSSSTPADRRRSTPRSSEMGVGQPDDASERLPRGGAAPMRDRSHAHSWHQVRGRRDGPLHSR